MTENAAIVVGAETPLPVPCVAVTAEHVREIENLCRRGRAMVVSDDETFARADALNADIRQLASAIEAERKKVKDPYYRVGQAIDKAAKGAKDKLAEVTRGLSSQLLAYQREQEKLARAAADEARRLQEEKDAAEAEKLTAAIADGDGTTAREIIQEMQEPEPPQDLAPVPAPVKSSSVTTRKLKRAVIEDVGKVPARIKAMGAYHELLEPNVKLIEKLLRQGVRIPGCRLEEVESIASRR